MYVGSSVSVEYEQTDGRLLQPVESVRDDLGSLFEYKEEEGLLFHLKKSVTKLSKTSRVWEYRLSGSRRLSTIS